MTEINNKESFMDSIYNVVEEIRNWPEWKKSWGCLNNDNTFTKIDSEKKYHPSSIKFEHQALYEKQEEKKSWLTRKDLELTLQNTSEGRLQSRTDFNKVIQELRRYNYICEDKLENGRLRYFIRSAEWF